ncbi:hypothetical protein FOZ60_014421 [Perkinsus olseni]|uniref:Uncharacterized protein n=1 Tax=Perkinsus olseni TaxID=32597 RepID=A0A7J6P710_PEROL|nr:hypothetical protein FOZ60_014421 [Perkinsus olseni]
MAGSASTISVLESAYRRLGRGAQKLDTLLEHLRRLRTDDLVFTLNKLGAAGGGCRGKENFWSAAVAELRDRLDEMTPTHLGLTANILSALPGVEDSREEGEGSRAIDARDVARCLHAVAKNGGGSSMGRLLAASRNSGGMSYGNAQDCAMAAGALAKAEE